MRDHQVSSARLVQEFRQRLRDLRTEVGSPAAADMIRAVKHTKGPRLHPSTLSEFLNDKRPTSLPGQDFVEAYVRACLRHRKDAPDEIERQVYGWLASRTGIVVSLGTPVTPADPVPAVPDPPPDLNLVCDRAELRAALDWLAGTGVEVPAGLPTADQWDSVMAQLSSADRVSWQAAYTRVRHHSCSGRRHRRLLFLAAAVVVVALVGVGLWLNTTPSVDSSIPCPAQGDGFTVLNHHSSMVINNQDRPRMGVVRGATVIGARYQPATPSDSFSSCLMTLRGNTPDGVRCLTSAAGDIVWAGCDDSAEQLWLEEPHWHDGTVQWDRLHLAARGDMCLQQSQSGGVGTPLKLVGCSTDWMQQWRLLSPG